ncbi:MAG: gluconate 2-dehydrogenase subunit 3 family protein [Acidimicrobiales bacterium]|nr:gluconate 2-dehydrogenase subunit 3 family protein [Acidimicrobiales bacterium]
MSAPRWLTPAERRTLEAALERLFPADDAGAPGARGAGVADYVDGLLGAFLVDPPRIWAGGPFSGRHGGDDGFSTFLTLGPVEELAWRTRIEGSQGRPEREWNGPVVGWQERYRAGLAGLGTDFAELDGAAQDARLADDPDFADLLHTHGCEGLYGDPVYGGNRGGAGWRSIAFAGDAQPRGHTPVEVTGRE